MRMPRIKGITGNGQIEQELNKVITEAMTIIIDILLEVKEKCK